MDAITGTAALARVGNSSPTNASTPGFCRPVSHDAGRVEDRAVDARANLVVPGPVLVGDRHHARVTQSDAAGHPLLDRHLGGKPSLHAEGRDTTQEAGRSGRVEDVGVRAL